MEKKDIEEFRNRVLCAAVLENGGWAIDLKESTRRAMKYRRGNEIVIVIHQGKGWFDPLSDAKGDVYSLASHLEGVGFTEALERVRALIGFVPSEPVWQRQSRSKGPDATIADRWRSRKAPSHGSSAWRYLTEDRAIPIPIVGEAVRLDLLREGPNGSMWARHTDGAGAVIGWEERGPEWRGFATGGGKELFRLGSPEVARICLTEAAIDAMSLAAVEGLRDGTLYASTGGGWAPATAAAITVLAARPGMLLVAATDANAQGEVFADRIRTISEDTGCDFQRLRPREDDWNEDLKMREEKKKKPARKSTCRMPAGRVKGGFARLAPTLDPSGREGGGGEA